MALAQGSRLPRPVAEENLRVLADAAKMSPADVRIPMAQAAQYLLTERPAAAIRAYHRAAEIEPRAEVYVNLGLAAEGAGELKEAVVAYRKAAWLDTDRVDELTGKIDDLRSELWQKAVEKRREDRERFREERRKSRREGT